MFILKVSQGTHFQIEKEAINVRIGIYSYYLNNKELGSLQTIFQAGLDLSDAENRIVINSPIAKAYLEFLISNRLLDFVIHRNGSDVLRIKLFSTSEILTYVDVFSVDQQLTDSDLIHFETYSFRVKDRYVVVETSLYKMQLFIPIDCFQLLNSSFMIRNEPRMSSSLVKTLNEKYTELYSKKNLISKFSLHDLEFDKATCFGRSSNAIGGIFKQKIERRGEIEGKLSDQLNVSSSISLNESNQTMESEFMQLQAKRESCREYSDRPISQDELLALCFRLAKAQAFPGGGRHKLYPSGGAIHECEFFIFPLNVSDMDMGVYWIDQDQQSLKKIEVDQAQLFKFLPEKYPFSWKTAPHFYLYIAADVSKRSYKYEGIALKNSLLNAGVIIEFLTLNALDLGIESCPLGGGDGEQFLKLLNLPPWSLFLTGGMGFGKRK